MPVTVDHFSRITSMRPSAVELGLNSRQCGHDVTIGPGDNRMRGLFQGFGDGASLLFIETGALEAVHIG